MNIEVTIGVSILQINDKWIEISPKKIFKCKYKLGYNSSKSHHEYKL